MNEIAPEAAIEAIPVVGDVGGEEALVAEEVKQVQRECQLELLSDRSVEEFNNSSGDAFHPGLYWKLLEPSGPTSNESEMTIGDVCFQDPSMIAEEHEFNCNGQP